MSWREVLVLRLDLSGLRAKPQTYVGDLTLENSAFGYLLV